MAETEFLNDAVFWLPSKFEDVLLVDKENSPVVNNGYVKKSDDGLKKPSSLSFPTEFPYEFDSLDSALGSPVESVHGSTETEITSDEDFLAGLTRRLTHSSTQKLAVPGLNKDKLESWVMAGSPESTLSGLGSWSVSSNGSPNGSSLVSSPPTTPFADQNDTWDLISAAAGEVARLKMSNEGYECNDINNGHGRGLTAPPKITPSPVHVIKHPNFGLYSNQSVNYSPAQTNQYQMLRPQNGGLNGVMRGRQQLVRSTWSTHPQPQQIQNKARSVVYENARCGRPHGLSQAAWPPLQVKQQRQPQQHSASGMKTVFLGGSGGVKRECSGTGVFLPRRYGNNPSDSRKKSGCSTVLVPAKVVQALNLSFDDINGNNTHAQHRFNTAFGPHYDALMARRTALLTLQKQRGLRPEAAPLNHEIHLPQEWTY